MKMDQAKLTQISSQCLTQRMILGGHARPLVSRECGLAAPLWHLFSLFWFLLLQQGNPLGQETGPGPSPGAPPAGHSRNKSDLSTARKAAMPWGKFEKQKKAKNF